MQERLPVIFPTRSPDPLYQWRCRSATQVSLEQQKHRWEQLIARFPSQDGLFWYLAKTQLRAGQLEEALSTQKKAPHMGGEAIGWVLLQGSQPYLPGRGWPLYKNGEITSEVLPDAFWETTRVLIDVDAPGETGAQLRLGWDGCGASQEIWVKEPSMVELPACVGRRSLRVAFLNDQVEGGDRNVYVSLEQVL